MPPRRVFQEGFSLTAPLVFYYGHTSLQENPELYKKLVVRVYAYSAVYHVYTYVCRPLLYVERLQRAVCGEFASFFFTSGGRVKLKLKSRHISITVLWCQFSTRV